MKKCHKRLLIAAVVILLLVLALIIFKDVLTAYIREIFLPIGPGGGLPMTDLT